MDKGQDFIAEDCKRFNVRKPHVCRGICILRASPVWTDDNKPESTIGWLLAADPFQAVVGLANIFLAVARGLVLICLQFQTKRCLSIFPEHVRTGAKVIVRARSVKPEQFAQGAHGLLSLPWASLSVQIS